MRQQNSLEYFESIMEDVNDLVSSDPVENATIESSNDENDETEAAQSDGCSL